MIENFWRRSINAALTICGEIWNYASFGACAVAERLHRPQKHLKDTLKKDRKDSIVLTNTTHGCYVEKCQIKLHNIPRVWEEFHSIYTARKFNNL